jgi:hypothetical protein
VPNTIYALAGLAARAPGGRDLTAKADGHGGAFGLRRAFADGQADLRLDGKLHSLRETLFFAAAADGTLYTGNGEGFSEEDSGRLPDEKLAGPLRALFRRFEEQLQGTERGAPRDPEVDRALRSLGYVG